MKKIDYERPCVQVLSLEHQSVILDLSTTVQTLIIDPEYSGLS